MTRAATTAAVSSVSLPDGRYPLSNLAETSCFRIKRIGDESCENMSASRHSCHDTAEMLLPGH